MKGHFDLTIDAQHPAALARFWAEVLRDYQIRPYDDAEIERLAALGFTPETDPSVALDPGSGVGGPTLFFQQSETATTARNRLHFDVRVAERATEEQRLTAIGASIHERRADHTVMLDPEGNQFCIFGG